MEVRLTNKHKKRENKSKKGKIDVRKERVKSMIGSKKKIQ